MIKDIKISQSRIQNFLNFNVYLFDVQKEINISFLVEESLKGQFYNFLYNYIYYFIIIENNNFICKTGNFNIF